MRVLMLGPLVVERDGQQVDLGGPRQRSVLAVLLLARGRPVSLDRLIDAVYDGDAPPSAVGSHALTGHASLSRLIRMSRRLGDAAIATRERYSRERPPRPPA